ncbi:MAG: (p)ppGpp synthetase [Spirochaetaceae bacterium]|jgi:putative GTP pyrophosphokinase|nr:(p)ppGpp synthetase [Spirochaetaceae bacterium]
MKNIIPDQSVLQSDYQANYEWRVKISKELEKFLEKSLSGLPSNLTIKSRVKSFKSFYKKYLRYMRESQSGIVKIPDEIGVRIICPFLEDINAAEEVIRETFTVLEVEKKGDGYSFKEFGYESHHILVRIPNSICEKYPKPGECDFSGEVAEIQIRTILQEAWAEVEHEFVYKAEFTPFGGPMKRKLAAINASLSLADTIFQEFRTHQRQLNIQLEKRRTNFYQKIEDSMDSFLVENEEKKKESVYPVRPLDQGSVDDLLLNALFAHNKGFFEQAESFYSKILSREIDEKVKAVIYKHRGMANFAQSKYEESISDFKEALKRDPTVYACAYYMGVVYSCLKDYFTAIEAFSRSLEINPHQKYCLFRRAQAYYHINDYPAALSDCESALALDGNFESVKKFKPLLLEKLAR